MKTLIVAALAAALAFPALAQTPVPTKLSVPVDGDAVTLEQRILTRIELVCGKPDDNALTGTFKLSRERYAECVNGLSISTKSPVTQAAFDDAKRAAIGG